MEQALLSALSTVELTQVTLLLLKEVCAAKSGAEVDDVGHRPECRKSL
jgi:hypothetical protein